MFGCCCLGTNELVLFFAVPPSKPVIRLGDSSGQSVEGYLGPYQIGTRLVLSCQVNGGKNPSKNSRALIANFVQKPDVIMYVVKVSGVYKFLSSVSCRSKKVRQTCFISDF